LTVLTSLIVALGAVIIVLGLVGVVAGWVTFGRTDDKAVIEVNTHAVREAAEETAETTVEAGKSIADTASKTFEDVTDRR
jgi:hypothetical protein